jgi:hypothetical protein
MKTGWKMKALPAGERRKTGSKVMPNPWLKKNPLMSMWLSSAHAAAGRTQSMVAAEASKQQAKLTKQAVRFWTDAWGRPKRRR